MMVAAIGNKFSAEAVFPFLHVQCYRILEKYYTAVRGYIVLATNGSLVVSRKFVNVQYRTF